MPQIAYETVGEYIPQIGEATVRFMSSSEAFEQAKNIMQFWTNLCATEKKMVPLNLSRNIIAQYKESLLPIIFQGLAIT